MNIEIRSENCAVISGYVNVAERESRAIRRAGAKPFREIVKSGTFKKALDKGGTVKLMLNHQKILCDTSSGLELREDNVGLYAEATVTDKETVSAAKNGKLTGWSFGFRCIADEWSEDGEHRTLSDIQLDEVSILTLTPAYIATSVEVRDDETMQEIRYSKDITVEDKSKVIKEEKFDNSTEKRTIEILKLRGV